MSGSLLSIIIVNWNTKDLLLQCIRSITNSLQNLTYELLVVDNASSDGSADAVCQQFSDVKIIANNLNKGFAAGVNQGIEYSTGNYVLILNPDIVLQPGCVEKLLYVFSSDKKVGIVTPRLINPDGTHQIGYFRKLPSLGQLVFFTTILQPWSLHRQSLVRRSLQDLSTNSLGSEEVVQIPGAFMLVPREVINDVGLMDEEFRLFFEDVDWCFRMRKKGWKLILYNDVSVVHLGGKSFIERDNFWMHGRFLLSMLYFFDKYGGWYEKSLSKVIAVSNSLLALAFRIFQLLLTVREGKKEQLRKSIKRHVFFLQEFWRHYIY